MKVTTVLPVSRTSYLDQVLEALVNQTHKPDNLIVVFDGEDSQYLEARNKVITLPFNVLYVHSTNLATAHTIPDRRRHIVNIHNQMRGLISECDYVWSIEDDGIVPLDALEKLLDSIQKLPDAGMVTGVELGRRGTPYVGAWVVDDVFSPKKVSSLENKSAKGSYDEIDGCGLYCALIRADLYKEHEFYTKNGLGPDVNLGLGIRQQGFKNYIDWTLHLIHLTHEAGKERQIHATDKSRIVVLTLLSGSTWHY